MPPTFTGKFSPIVELVRAQLDAGKAPLGLKRVNLGSFGDGTQLPEAWVTIANDEPIAPVVVPQGADRTHRPVTMWAIPLVIAVEKDYPELMPSAGMKALEDIVLLGEKVVDLLTSALPAGVRHAYLRSATVTEAPGGPTTLSVELRMSYEVVLSG